MSKEEAWRSVGEMACGPSTKSVEWKIRDYFNLPQEVDRVSESPTFNFCDGVWYLRLYPNGASEKESEGWMSLYVMKKHPAASKHQMQYRVGIVKRDGSVVESRSTKHLFEKVYTGNGWKRLYKVSELERQRDELVPEGVLTICCTLAVNTPEGVEAAVQTERPEGVEAAVQTERREGVEKLVHDFKELLLNGEATDVTLKVGNREYKVHSAVLVARSAVFSALMRNDMREKSSGVVQIDDCDPEAFQQFLTYLYTGDLENFSADTVCALHGIADKYQTDELKVRCVQFLGENLSVETFCDVVTLSLRHNESGLLEIAVQFFAKNMKDILVTTKWLSFAKENLVEANEVLIKSVDYNARLK